MDLIDKLNQLAARIIQQRDSVLTEEAAKTAFVLPFLQALGYDVFNPAEVVPELTADHGVKKGEKVDYAIKQDGKIAILIECKSLGADLEAKHAGQLFRYFSVTDARFGVLTDGIRYLFFSDLERENRMDDRSFFEFNLLQFGSSEIDELKKFTKSSFDLETIIGTASNLKYHKALISELRKEFDKPSDDFVKLLTSRVYPGRYTQQVRDQFTELTQKAVTDFIRERVNERLKSALDTDTAVEPQASAHAVDHGAGAESSVYVDKGIETTKEELEGFRIIRAIAAEFVTPERVVMRDAKSYCAILLDDNNRRPICRFHFGKTKMTMTTFGPDREQRRDIENVVDIYRYKEDILAAVLQYNKNIVPEMT